MNAPVIGSPDAVLSDLLKDWTQIADNQFIRHALPAVDGTRRPDDYVLVRSEIECDDAIAWFISQPGWRLGEERCDTLADALAVGNQWVSEMAKSLMDDQASSTHDPLGNEPTGQ